MGTEGFKNGKKVLNERPTILKGGSYIFPESTIALMADMAEPCNLTGTATFSQCGPAQIVQTGTASTVAKNDAGAGGAAGQAGLGGWLGGSADNVDAEIDSISLGGSAAGTGDGGWLLTSRAGASLNVMEAGFVIPVAATARQYYVGWTDNANEGTATNGPLNIQSALTVVDPASNAAGFIFSSLATAPTVWKYANTNANTQMTNAITAAITNTVDYYTKLRVEIDAAGTAYFYGAIATAATGGRDIEVAHIATLASAVATTSVLLPSFTAAATTTTAVEWEIDYLFGAGRA